METWKKKSRFAEPEIFLGFEIDLDFSRPGFSDIRVQIKRPNKRQTLQCNIQWYLIFRTLNQLKEFYLT